MTRKERHEQAESLRWAARILKKRRPDLSKKMIDAAADLEPSDVETVVLWRYPGHGDFRYLGLVHDQSDGVFAADGLYHSFEDIEYIPISLCGPNEFPVEVDPVSKWPDSTMQIEIVVRYRKHTGFFDDHIVRTITLKEAALLEAER